MFLLLAVLAFWQCAPRPEAERTSVVLVIIDTLGAENVGAFAGSFPSPTPRLDRLADEAVLFRRAYSPAPWTQPSVASLLTSRLPSEHGVLRLFDVLAEDRLTLAEVLTQVGYRSGAIVSHRLLSADLGFGQGFSHHDDSLAGGHRTITSEAVTAAALAWLDEQPDGAPFFLLAHYFDPHYVYQHRPEFDRTSGYGGALVPDMPIWDLRNAGADLSTADVAYLEGLYREEVAATDAAVGALVDGLVERALVDRSLLVVTADHGEEILRRGWLGHTRTLYEELIHVPLLMRLPGGGAQSFDEPVSLIDVAPTILDLVGVARPEGFAGRSLAGWIRGLEEPTSQPVRAEVAFDDLTAAAGRAGRKTAFKTAVVDGSYKVIHDLIADRWELYDLASDPLEEHNLAADEAAESHPEEPRLRRYLLRWEQARGELSNPRAKPSAEALEELRALGYLR